MSRQVAEARAKTPGFSAPFTAFREFVLSSSIPKSVIARSIPEITTLPRSRIGRAEELFGAAFIRDPMAVHFFPEIDRRARGLRRVFRAGLEYGLRFGDVEMADDGAAIAIWLRPGMTSPHWLRILRAGILGIPFAAGWSATGRILSFLRFIDTAHSRAMPGPHWYLFGIAVQPGLQGRGIGAALLQHGLKRARSEGLPCYLETTNVHNLPFYEKHGFRLVQETAMAGGGLRVWNFVAEASDPGKQSFAVDR